MMPSPREKTWAPWMFSPVAASEPAIFQNNPARSQVQTFTSVKPRSRTLCQWVTGSSARSSSES